LSSAARLEKLAPEAGHLLHMPSHIYARVGDYILATRVNANAVAADQRFLASTRQPGLQAVMLYLHDLHFLAYANCMSGNFADAKRAAAKLVAEMQPYLKEMPMLEGFAATPLFVLLAFERWDDILNVAAPDRSLIYTTANWHFARGMAFAASGKADQAEHESKAYLAGLAKLPRDAVFDPYNSVASVAGVQENLLAGTIKGARSGREDKAGEVSETLRRAIAAEDALNYTEPSSWYPPVRPILGRVLLDQGKAVAAEKVFRDALEKTPRYFRALTGLRDSLRAQHRDYEAEQIELQLRQAQNQIDAISTARSRQ